MISDLTLAVLSDIHLGNSRTPTAHILESLRQALPDDEETAELDLILLAGDVFDDLMTFNSDEVIMISEWVLEFLRLCARRGIVVRILEGTPSHDWRQSRVFDTMNRALDHRVDLKYVSTVSVEYIELLGLHVLYVPDEVDTPDKVWEMVQRALRDRGLHTVDLACMHGVFDYQLPISHSTHNSTQYESIVNGPIFIGHHHTHYPRGKIIPPGSVDRLKHGEEEPKGHVRARLFKEGGYDWWFVENRNAKLYTTLDLRGLDIEQALSIMLSYERYPDHSHLRLHLSRGDTLVGAVEVLRRRYPQFKFDTLIEGDSLEESEEVWSPEHLGDVISITPDNIIDLARDRLPPLEAAVERRVFELLQESC